MIKNLVIVESPAKARTIERFLGKDYTVKSSMGHVMDLSKKDLGVDIEKGYEPHYEISDDKKKVVSELKKIAKEAEIIWLATDEDREGEAISWHLVKALKLDEEKTRRIVFHEITKSAIEEAIDQPRGIDKHLVNAQQARRVLDRLVGFELSPLLWKKVKPALSAGRVQSVAVRLIVEREEEIKKFEAVSSYRIQAEFVITGEDGNVKITAELPRRLKTREEAVAFLEKMKGSGFAVSNVEKKPAKRSPAPPFTTSTLQQEASRKLGFSVANTMRVAQQLYESGNITYMRTDSVALSKLALATAAEEIKKQFGEEYLKTRQFSTRSKGAQEAHEAIRPTYLSKQTIEGNASQKRLYELIWKRTIASQMSDAVLERTNIDITASPAGEVFVAKGEVIKFDGFLKVYIESSDDEENGKEGGILPPLKKGDSLSMLQMIADQRFTQPPRRFTEASLVKKLEELGIGRPSTYAPTISTIQKREYVAKNEVPGTMRNYDYITLRKDVIKEEVKKERVGNEKGKLAPTDLGVLVNRFLVQFFDNIIDYNFTAKVEKEFDEIARGKRAWNEMIDEFYGPFHHQIQETQDKTKKFSGERLLGKDPDSGKNVYVKLGRYGPVIQIGETEDDEKPKFAGLRSDQSIETIKLNEALALFDFPRNLGSFENSDVEVAIGRYGPYVKHNKQFFSLPKQDEPSEVQLERAIEIIEEKRKADKEKIIKTFDEEKDLSILKGRYGPYIKFGKDNFRIPKGTNPEELTLEESLAIIEKQKGKKGKKK